MTQIQFVRRCGAARALDELLGYDEDGRAQLALQIRSTATLARVYATLHTSAKSIPTGDKRLTNR